MKEKKVFYFNKIYNAKNRYKKPKEIFQFLVKKLKIDKVKKNSSLIDIGCSNGELLFNLSKNFNFKLTGIDVDKNLLIKAKKNCPSEVSFFHKDISKKNLKLKKYDIVVLSGVLSIFKDGKNILKNVLKLVKPKGVIYIFDSLNIYSYNLHIKANKLEKGREVNWYKNMYSTDYIKKFFGKYNKKCKFFQFRMKKNIKKDKSNLNYGWTEILSGKKIITSGLGLIQNQFWVKIK